MSTAYPPDLLRALLTRSRTVAIVGASPDSRRASFGIMRYLQRSGYRVIPVNPKASGQVIHGEPVVSALSEISEPIDLVNVFRRPDALLGIVEDTVAAGAPAIWAQLGVWSEAAERRAAEAGITLVMNRCISIEHSRLMR